MTKKFTDSLAFLNQLKNQFDQQDEQGEQGDQGHPQRDRVHEPRTADIKNYGSIKRSHFGTPNLSANPHHNLPRTRRGHEEDELRERFEVDF